MGLSVPAHIVFGETQTKICAQVDDALCQGGVLVDLLHCAAVGQAEEEQVAGQELAGADKLQAGASPQIGMGEVHKIAGVALAGHLLEGDMWMVEQQTEQFPASIAAGADNRNGEGGSHYVLAPAVSVTGWRGGRSLDQPLAVAQPSLPTRRQKSTILAGMSTPVGAMLLRNSIV